MEQLALPLGWSEAGQGLDFIISDANALAVQHLSNAAGWRVPVTLLTGPRKSGKSLLARFCARSGDVDLIDDANLKDEADIFHAWNRATASERRLLVVAEVPPPLWDIGLPDLRSRMLASNHVQIDQPDDQLWQELLIRLLAVRGLMLMPEMAEYLLLRCERSYLSIQLLVDRIDMLLLSRRGGLNWSLIRALVAAEIEQR